MLHWPKLLLQLNEPRSPTEYPHESTELRSILKKGDSKPDWTRGADSQTGVLLCYGSVMEAFVLVKDILQCPGLCSILASADPGFRLDGTKTITFEDLSWWHTKEPVLMSMLDQRWQSSCLRHFVVKTFNVPSKIHFFLSAAFSPQPPSPDGFRQFRHIFEKSHQDWGSHAKHLPTSTEWPSCCFFCFEFDTNWQKGIILGSDLLEQSQQWVVVVPLCSLLFLLCKRTCLWNNEAKSHIPKKKSVLLPVVGTCLQSWQLKAQGAEFCWTNGLTSSRLYRQTRHTDLYTVMVFQI